MMKKNGVRKTRRLLKRCWGISMKSKKGISVVIPCFNERFRIESTLAEIEDVMGRMKGLIHEVIICDDASRDATVEVALRWKKKLPLRVVRLAENRGKWAAIHKGIEVAKSEYILVIDADGSASVYELERIRGLAKHMESGDAIFGSRFMKGATIEGKSWLRIIVSRVYRAYASILFSCAQGGCCEKKSVDDMQAPFKLFPRLSVKVERLVVERFAGDIELALNIEAPIVNHPLRFVHKRGSKVPVSAILSMAVETMRVAWRFRKSKI